MLPDLCSILFPLSIHTYTTAKALFTAIQHGIVGFATSFTARSESAPIDTSLETHKHPA